MEKTRPAVPRQIYDFISDIGNGSFHEGLMAILRESKFVREPQFINRQHADGQPPMPIVKYDKYKRLI